ncbi:MAG: glycosyltransferase family 2 protein [Erysipelotrichaceae bacterium]|nr:glycosyltransferase family 2 protein [Erysipelotrichaceae bacterium]
MRIKKKELVTLILPVYNVAEYIDQCLETVCAQTYPELEILLINDGSTDTSLSVLKKWEAKDSRVRVIDKANEGVARTRNLGVKEAKGTVIGFVDPDDWLDLSYVEELLAKMQEEDAEYVECDLWRVDGRNGKQIYRSCGSRMGVPYTPEEHMRYGPTATYKALSRKELWDRYDIHMPSCSFESPAVYSLILALSRKNAYVPEALYYYRRFRPASLVETGYSADPLLGVEAMRFLVCEFKRCGIYERYKDVLPGIVIYRLNDILAMQYHRKREEDFRLLVQNYRELIGELFPDLSQKSYLLWGGYNLNRILSHLPLLQDPSCRFNFSSLISLLKERKETYSLSHKNRYRQMMLEKEEEQSYFEVLKEKQPAYLFMDFLEERFDILESDSYRTLSDAREGAAQQTAGLRIVRDSEECTALWKESFEYFCRRSREICPTLKIIILENCLSERVGNMQEQKDFENIEEIRRTDRILKEYYRYVKENHPEIRTVETGDLPLYFTDEHFEYGAVPSHLNEIVNQEIAERLEKIL